MLSAFVFFVPAFRYVYRILLEYTALQIFSWVYTAGLVLILLIRDKEFRKEWFLPAAAYTALSPFLLLISRYTLMPGSAEDNALPYWLYLVQIAAFFLWMAALIAGIRMGRNKADGTSKFASGFGLTARETEVAFLVIQGLTNPKIAEKLSITTETVKKHIQNIYQKTDCESKIELANKLALQADAPGGNQ